MNLNGFEKYFVDKLNLKSEDKQDMGQEDAGESQEVLFKYRFRYNNSSAQDDSDIKDAINSYFLSQGYSVKEVIYCPNDYLDLDIVPLNDSEAVVASVNVDITKDSEGPYLVFCDFEECHIEVETFAYA